jgi:MFS family permease
VSLPFQHTSSVGGGVSLLLVGVCFSRAWPAWVLVVLLCVFMGFFSLGMGAITFVVASEVFPLSVRVRTGGRLKGRHVGVSSWSVGLWWGLLVWGG